MKNDNSDQFIIKIDDKKNAITVIGDLHPSFEGNVVSAMASAKKSYKIIDKILEEKIANNNFDIQKIKEDFIAKIHNIKFLSKDVLELEIKAPLQAISTKIGHIFRLQNFENDKISRQINPIPITAAKIEKDVITCYLLASGGSSEFVKDFYIGQEIIFMGPSGNATEIYRDEKILLVASGRGVMPILEIAKSLKKQNCEVYLFLEIYDDIKIEDEKQICDQLFVAFRDDNIAMNLRNFIKNSHVDFDKIFTIADDEFMYNLYQLRNELLPRSQMVVSLNASMQCMMKGVCSQCLQRRVNEKGEFEYFYSCAKQYQDADGFDFQYLKNQTKQNSLLEKISKFRISLILRDNDSSSVF